VTKRTIKTSPPKSHDNEESTSAEGDPHEEERAVITTKTKGAKQHISRRKGNPDSLKKPKIQ